MKKYVLIISLALSVLVFLIEKVRWIDSCKKNYDCFVYSLDVAQAFIFFFVVFLFSLITYFSPERVFQSWWKFARIGIPVAFILSLIINLELHHNPHGQWQDIFDLPALILIYIVFTAGSILQIWKGFRQK